MVILILGSSYRVFTGFLILESTHQATELFQACAFTVRVVSVLFSVRDLWKMPSEEQGPGGNMV